MKIGEVIKEARLKKGLTQSALGDLAGTTAANISRIESGKHGAGTDLLNSIAFVLGFKVHQLVALAEGFDLPDSPNRFSLKEIELINAYRSMSQEQQSLFDDIAKGFIKSSKK